MPMAAGTHRIARFAALAVCGILMLPVASAAGSPRHDGMRVSAPLPGIDPVFVYDQLAYMTSHFQRREAGYLTGSAGHAGFARYWTREMLRLLGSFGARAQSDPFRLRGWLGRPATAPGADLEVTVPGLTDPVREVVIGCHYDGEADSTQSAYDDASGCAIELGVARAIGRFWRSNHLYPARTLRFILFDGEEQGLFGSAYYVNQFARGDLPYIAAMVNEEQSGIGYPLRYLGRSANALMPTTAWVSPLTRNPAYANYRISPAQRTAIVAFRQLVSQAVPAAFAEFRAIGDQMLTYHDRTGQPVWQPIFTPAQLRYAPVQSDTVGRSDHFLFAEAGVPSLMLLGNFTYYDPNAPLASFPFDQPTDTVQLMNAFADGGTSPSHALELALALPGMISTWLLPQPAVLGAVPADGRPAAAIGEIGVIRPGRPARFNVAAAYIPGRPATSLRYAWRFGDGTAATGTVVRHVFHAPGRYELRLTVSWPGGSTVLAREVSVGSATTFTNPYGGALPKGPPALVEALRGVPPPNSSVTAPVPSPRLQDQVSTVAQVRRLTAHARPLTASSTGMGAGIAIAIAVVILAAFVLVMLLRFRVHPTRRSSGP